jgi:hypothetical protein
VPAVCSSPGIPVAINNVDCLDPYDPPNGPNCDCYRNNALPEGGGAIDTEMDGLTQVFYATAQIQPGTNHLKLAIADCGDGIYDSNVMIACQSFTCSAPPRTGACCFAGDCFLLSGIDCLGQGGIYHGDDVPCYPSPCPGACCDADGECTVSAQGACGSPAIWHSEWQTCEPNPCPQPGACCDPATGGCTMTLQSACEQPLLWHEDWTTCEPNPCPQPGACCDPATGACTMTLQSACEQPLLWHEDWTTCEPNPCPQMGACCDPATGACTMTLPSACAQPMIWHGEMAICSPNPCPQLGVCCDPTAGLCDVTIEEQCAAPNIWHGEWVTCSPDPCPTSSVPPTMTGAKDSLIGAVPNPFAATTALWFRLPEETQVRMEIVDAAGHRVRLLSLGLMGAGYHSIEWDGRTSEGIRVAPGVYFARLSAGARSWTRAVISIR